MNYDRFQPPSWRELGGDLIERDVTCGRCGAAGVAFEDSRDDEAEWEFECQECNSTGIGEC